MNRAWLVAAMLAISLGAVYGRALNVPFILGVALSLSGKNPQAVEQFQVVLEADPNDVNAHNNLGLLLSSAGESEEAIRHFEQALRLGANRSDLRHNLAEVFRRVGQTNDAIQHYQAAVKSKSEDLQARVNLAQTLAVANRSQETIATATMALEVARVGGQSAAAEQIEEWLHHYQAELRRNENVAESSK